MNTRYNELRNGTFQHKLKKCRHIAFINIRQGYTSAEMALNAPVSSSRTPGSMASYAYLMSVVYGYWIKLFFSEKDDESK